jgi:hypothetical protein
MDGVEKIVAGLIAKRKRSGIERFTDDELARAFDVWVKFAELDNRVWMYLKGEWTLRPQSPDPKLPYLEVIRMFCREQRSLLADNNSGMAERQRYRLGQLSTFRAIHKLIRPELVEDAGPHLHLALIRLEAAKWFSEPASKADFELGEPDHAGRRLAKFKGEWTRFYVTPTVIGDKRDREYGPPYYLNYGGSFFQYQHQTVESVVEAMGECLLLNAP